MPYADPERMRTSAVERKRRHRERKHAAKYGPGAGDQRGKSRKASGAQHPRWNDGRMFNADGYVKIRVGREHPLADPNGYAYEHLLVWISAGRTRPAMDETLHHKNEDKSDNRFANLELLTRVAHSIQHHASLTDDQVRTLRERYAAGEDGTTLAGDYGVPFQRVYKLLRGETRRAAGGPIQTGSLRGKKLTGRLLDGVEHNEFPEIS